MTNSQILGALMLVLFMGGLYGFMARDMGFKEALKGLCLAIALTAFVFVGAMLMSGELKL